MFIRKLRPDERAPATADRVRIDRLPDGRMTWNGRSSLAALPCVASEADILLPSRKPRQTPSIGREATERRNY